MPSHEIGAVTIIEPSGRLDAFIAPQLDEALRKALSAGRTRLVVDLAQVSYTSSSTLRVLLVAVRQARRQGGDLKLCNPSARVRQVFALAGFDRVFQLWATCAEAVAAFAAPPANSESVCSTPS